MLRVLIACVGVMVGGCMSSDSVSAQGADRLTIDKEHMIGVVDAHFANLESLQKFDVLMRIRTSRIGDKFIIEADDQGVDQMKVIKGPDAEQVVDERTSLHRVMFDKPNGTILILNRCEFTRESLDGLGEPIGAPTKRFDDRSLLIDPQRGIRVARSKPGFSQKVAFGANVPIERLIDSYGVPNFKFAGFHTVLRNGDQVLQYLERFRNVDAIEEILNTGQDRYQVFSRHDIDSQDSRLGIRCYQDWNIEWNVPVRFEIFPGYRAEDFPDTTEPHVSGNVEWKLLDGCFVPISGRVSSKAAERVNGSMYKVIEEVLFDFHWFSVHRDLPEGLLTENLLQDRKKLDELLDQSVFKNTEDSK